jgi:hypothetical protein
MQPLEQQFNKLNQQLKKPLNLQEILNSKEITVIRTTGNPEVYVNHYKAMDLVLKQDKKEGDPLYTEEEYITNKIYLLLAKNELSLRNKRK